MRSLSLISKLCFAIRSFLGVGWIWDWQFGSRSGDDCYRCLQLTPIPNTISVRESAKNRLLFVSGLPQGFMIRNELPGFVLFSCQSGSSVGPRRHACSPSRFPAVVFQLCCFVFPSLPPTLFLTCFPTESAS